VPLLLVYNLSAYDENFSNPTAILERLYVHLGHARFVDSVFVFGSQSCHHSCVPIRPLAELDETLDRLEAAGRVPALVGYAVKAQSMDAPEFPKERQWIMSELERRFVLRLHTPDDVKYARFTLEARGRPSNEPMPEAH
jgi:hypothetical protein